MDAPQVLTKVGSHYHPRVKGPGGGPCSWNPERATAVGERLLTDNAVLVKEAVAWQGGREGVKYIPCPLPPQPSDFLSVPHIGLTQLEARGWVSPTDAAP